MTRLVLILILLPSLLSGCVTTGKQAISANVVDALSAPADADFARVLTPTEFHFPLDHGAHPDYRTEWWYYTGNLQSDDGDQFGYQLTFFRTGLTPGTSERSSDWAANQIYMAHFAISDVKAQKHQSAERFSRGAGGLAGAMGEPNYEIWLDNWSVRTVQPGITHLQASEIVDNLPIAIDLTLEETIPPLLHGDKGLSQKGSEAGNANYYYSLVQIKSAGTLTLGDTTRKVHGVSWMDHEFGTSALSQGTVGWDWFSVQMENGLVLMFAQLRTKEGEQAGNFAGTLLLPNGTQQPLTQKDFRITTLGEWRSTATGITYPSGWQVDFPGLQLNLKIEPLIKDQEMKVSYVYWEGAVGVVGTLEGNPVQGAGYVELTGYGEANEEYQR